MIKQGTYKGVLSVAFIVAVCIVFNSCKKDSDNLPQFTSSNTGPYLLNIEYLELIDSLRTEDPVLNKAYQDLILGADSLLLDSLSYVADKKKLPPSGDPHDYMSIHKYSYYNPETGKYDIIKDGQINPEFYDYDKPKLEKMSYSVYALALAYYYTGDERFAQKASKEIKNWFMNPETRMNPNMNFSGVRFGISEGPGAGIVGALDFIDIIEAASLLYGSQYWTPDLHFELKEWFFEFYKWIRNHYNPDAYDATNVSTWLDVQRGVYLLFTEQEGKLNSSNHIQPVSQRLENQIEANGLQPYESKRGIPQHYVYFNLKAYMKLSVLRKNYFTRTGNDRDWPVLKSESGGLKAALDNIAAFVKQENETSLFSSDPDFRTCRYLEIFRPAAVVFNSIKYEEAAQNLISMGCRNSDLLLTYPSVKNMQKIVQ